MNTERRSGGWHLPAEQLAIYARGSADPLTRASVEAHLVACAACQRGLAELVRADTDGSPDRVWARIVDTIDEPRRRLPWATDALRVSLASPTLTAVTASLAALLVLGVAVARMLRPGWSGTALLCLAPLVPVTSVVLAFRPGADPAGSMAAATPFAGGRLPFLRALVAVSAAIAAGLAGSVLTSVGWREILLWLLPGLALSACVLALSTWFEPANLAGVLSAGWTAVVVASTRRVGGRIMPVPLERFVTNRPSVQIICVVVIVVAAALSLFRRDALPNWRSA